jgi:predicted CopG family antitoxin
MAKPLSISETAYAVLQSQKRPKESFSDVIVRLIPPRIDTFGDLLDYLETTDAPLMDPGFLKELRRRKQRPKRSPRKSNAH